MADRVSLEDLKVAAMWLEHNEGDEDGEGAACARVAEMLRAEIERRETAAAAREAGKRLGRKLTVAQFRAAVARHDAKTKDGAG